MISVSRLLAGLSYLAIHIYIFGISLSLGADCATVCSAISLLSLGSTLTVCGGGAVRACVKYGCMHRSYTFFSSFFNEENGGGRDGESEIEHHWDW